MPVDVHEHLWIPMSDGCRLAARAWIPRAAASRPVPAVLEYVPYRKRAGTRWRDEPIHGYFAQRGYACLRVDVRGTGESDGQLDDEYSEAELRDGEELLAWIAAQPWCSGSVGMIGKSWGGINALQLAVRRPPALAAVVTVCSTVDRYGLDAHYMGGCLLGENLLWGSSLLTVAALPPDPALVGGDWREQWRTRIERLPLYPALWMGHPHRDAYWTRGSVEAECHRITCPVLAVGGWADAYTGGVFRLLERVEAPCRGLVGPWAHLYPHDAAPEPSVGFLEEAASWWDRWLGSRPPGHQSPLEPALRVWLGDGSHPGSADRAPSGGRWVAEARWPSDRVGTEPWRLLPGQLARDVAAPRNASIRIATPAVVGRASGRWCSFGEPGDYPGDQREDDALSVCFDASPGSAAIDLLGRPVLELELAREPGPTLVAARLCDVAPDGRSTRIGYGLLDLTGVSRRVRMELEPVGWTLRPGHRLRLALSTDYWPLAWPGADLGGITLRLAGCGLELPVRAAPGDEVGPRIPGPDAAPEPPMTDLARAVDRRERTQDPVTGVEELRIEHGWDADGAVACTRYDEIGVLVGHAVSERYRIHPRDRGQAQAEVEHHRVVAGDGWRATVRVWCRLTGAPECFRLETELEARLDDALFASRTWDVTIPRDP